MTNKEHACGDHITIPAGTMVNRSGHEDDECHILIVPTEAVVVGPIGVNGLPIEIPSIEPSRPFFLHLPAEPEKASQYS